MSAVLQEIVVGVLVAGCALLSAWRLASARLRLRALDALGAVPGLRDTRALARLRQRTTAQFTAGCGGCSPATTPGAASRNQTTGALRR